MDFSNDKFQEQFSEKNVFVDELIYENIKLMKENIGLILDNNSLREKVEESEDSKALDKVDFADAININIEIVIGKVNHN